MLRSVLKDQGLWFEAGIIEGIVLVNVNASPYGASAATDYYFIVTPPLLHLFIPLPPSALNAK